MGTFGRYRLGDKLGEGGMGVVYRAHDEATGREVALKVLRGAGARNAREVSRLQREASLLARVDHPGIVGVLDAGAVDQVPYVALAYVRGRPLDKCAFPLRDTVRLLAQVARAVGAAHRASIVHRDLKPSNVLVEDGTGNARVLDFGLAFDARLDATRLSVTGEVLGTPAYMAPETVEGKARGDDPRLDTYALGVMLYERLAGEHPFAHKGQSVAAVIDRVRKGAPSLSSRDEVDATLAALCDRAVALDPARRPRDGDAFAAELEAWLAAPASPPRRSRRVVPLVAGVLLLAGGLLVATRGKQEVAPPPPPPPVVVKVPPAPPRLAPEEERLAIDEAIEAIVERRDEAVDEIAAVFDRAADLARRYPDDPKVQALRAKVGMRTPWREHESRRLLVRLFRAKAIPGLRDIDHAGRFAHALGFERASAEVGETLFADDGVQDPRYGVYLVQLYLKAAPPVAWPERARKFAERLLATKTPENVNDYPDSAMLYAHVADAAEGLDDPVAMADAWEASARHSTDPVQTEQMLTYVEALRAGKVKLKPSRMGRSILLFFATTPFLKRVKALDDRADVADAEAAGGFAALGDEVRGEGHAEAAALAYLRAGRVFARTGDHASACEVLQRAVALSLPAEAIDTRALVRVALARSLLEGSPSASDLARAEALAREAVARVEGFDPRSAGELVDAWVLVARACRARRDTAGARDAVDRARALYPLDARELERP